MDKRTAILTLTEKLRKSGYINLIIDPTVKACLLNTAKHKVLDSGKGRIRAFSISSIDLGEFEREVVQHIPYSLEHLFPQANYFFVEGGSKSDYGDTWRNALVTPAALVGEIEEQVLRGKFYKNVPEKISKSFEVLEITNFIDAYNVYSLLKPDEFLPLRFGVYRPFKKGEIVSLGDIIQGSTSKRYYTVEEIKSNGDIEGHRFQDIDLKTPATGKKDDNIYGECCRNSLIPVKKYLYDTSFFDFVFALPYEDQNIEVNKVIIKSLNDSDSCMFLQKEYINGKCFKDYFSVLSEGCRKKVVEGIKSLPNQNKFLNSWIFSQGFDVKIDYLELYKQDAKMFIDYFKRAGTEFQELIVSDLFNCEHINKEVIEFLEKEHAPLLRDVSFKK